MPLAAAKQSCIGTSGFNVARRLFRSRTSVDVVEPLSNSAAGDVTVCEPDLEDLLPMSATEMEAATSTKTQNARVEMSVERDPRVVAAGRLQRVRVAHER